MIDDLESWLGHEQQKQQRNQLKRTATLRASKCSLGYRWKWMITTTIYIIIFITLNQNVLYTLASAGSSGSSLPRSPPSKSRRYAQNQQQHHLVQDDLDGISTQHHQPPPWNPSSLINSTTGLLKDIYQRIPGEWENEYRLKPTQNTVISDDPTQYCRIRQVPGDGNCLFHSISVGLNFLVNRTHYDLSTTSMAINTHIDNDDDEHDHDDPQYSDGYSMSGRGTTMTRRRKRKPPTLDDLYIHSQYLRDECVKYLRSALEYSDVHNKRAFYRRFSSNHHPLYVQGREYIHGHELIHAAAQQYNISDMEYCNTMAEDCVWGGGPEIVVLCNLLQRPIHVYELISSTTTTTTAYTGDGHSEAPPHTTTGSTGNSWTSQLLPHYPNSHPSQPAPSPAFVLRRMACFGSPKYDHKKAIHILSADSRFPDLRPGQQLSAGNHFLAVFPMEENSNDDADDIDPTLIEQRRRRKRIRGGDSSNDGDDIVRWNNAHSTDDLDLVVTSKFQPMNIVRRLVTQYIDWWQDLFE
jgi:hypothetical protein